MPTAAPPSTTLPSSSRTPPTAMQVAILLTALAILGCEIYRFINDSRRIVQPSPELIAINELKTKFDTIIRQENQDKNMTSILMNVITILTDINNKIDNLFIQVKNINNKEPINKKPAGQSNGSKESEVKNSSDVNKTELKNPPRNDKDPKVPGKSGTNTQPDKSNENSKAADPPISHKKSDNSNGSGNPKFGNDR